MNKLKAGLYEIKPDKNTKKPTIQHKAKTHDNMYYTYTTRDYNSSGEEIFQIHIHEPETLLGKIKHKILSCIR